MTPKKSGWNVAERVFQHNMPKKAIEGYYSLSVAKNTWLSFDYQHVDNPAYNADRSPVRIIGSRLHLGY